MYFSKILTIDSMAFFIEQQFSTTATSTKYLQLLLLDETNLSLHLPYFFNKALFSILKNKYIFTEEIQIMLTTFILIALSKIFLVG